MRGYVQGELSAIHLSATPCPQLLVTNSCIGMQPAQKKPRGADLLRLGRVHFATQSAMASILAAVKADGVPEYTSRKAQHNAIKRFAERRTPYGPLVTTLVLGAITVAVQCPGPMLLYCATNCAGFT